MIAFITTYFSMFLLKTRTFSYKTTEWLYKNGELILTHAIIFLGICPLHMNFQIYFFKVCHNIISYIESVMLFCFLFLILFMPSLLLNSISNTFWSLIADILSNKGNSFNFLFSYDYFFITNRFEFIHFSYSIKFFKLACSIFFE